MITPLRSGAPASYPYEVAPASSVERRLDVTEFNMERLNRVGRGAATVYQVLRLAGRVDPEGVRGALEALQRRHPMLRRRIVRDPEGQLGFAATEAPIPFVVRTVEDPGAWGPWATADMNAGAIPCHAGPFFSVGMLVGNRAELGTTLIFAGSHAVCDGLSILGLARELLEMLGGGKGGEPRPDREVGNPFQLAPSPDVARRLAELGEGASLAEIESLEADMLGQGRDGLHCAALPELWKLRAEANAREGGVSWLDLDADAGAPATRTASVCSGLITDRIDATTTAAVRAAAKSRGLRMHAVLGAVTLLALAERAQARHGVAPDGRRIALGSPVDLRRLVSPPLSEQDVRMTVDVSVTPTLVRPGDDVWEVARRFGGHVVQDLERLRPLASWVQTARRDPDAPIAGGRLPLLSNMGVVRFEPRYGDLEVREVWAALAVHNTFPLATGVVNFQGVMHLAHCLEEPSFSLDSGRSHAERVRSLLRGIAAAA